MLRDEDLALFEQGLQEEIIENARKKYSDRVIDEWLNPENFSVIDNANSQGTFRGPSGEFLSRYQRS